ncbi:16531_t:CDS:2, partial [Acaulospora colombiana]
MTDIDITPPPVPPKDDFRPITPPKDFPRTNSWDYASTSTVIVEDSNSTSNTFPGAKGTNKNLANQLTSSLDEIFVEPINIAESTNKTSVYEPQIVPSSSGDNDPVVATPSGEIPVAPIRGNSSPESSPEPSIKVSDPITANTKPDDPPKVKKSSSLTNLFRRLSYRKRGERSNSSSTMVEDQSNDTGKFSTVPKAKSESKKSGFGSLIERFNLKFSSTNNHRDTGQIQTDEINDTNGNTSTLSSPPRIDWSLSSNNRRALRKTDLKQKQKEVLVD